MMQTGGNGRAHQSSCGALVERSKPPWSPATSHKTDSPQKRTACIVVAAMAVQTMMKHILAGCLMHVKLCVRTARRVQCLVRGEYETGVRQGVKRGGVPGGSRGNLVGVDWCQAGREAGCKAGWCLLRMEPVAFSLIPMLLGKPDKCLKDGERGCIHLSKVKRCFTCPSPC